MTEHIAPRTWARPDYANDVPFCAIRVLEGGSCRTVCDGSWPSSDTAEIANAPPDDDCCLRCRIVLGISRTPTPVERPLPVFDVSDFEDEDVTVTMRPVLLDFEKERGG